MDIEGFVLNYLQNPMPVFAVSRLRRRQDGSTYWTLVGAWRAADADEAVKKAAWAIKELAVLGQVRRIR